MDVTRSAFTHFFPPVHSCNTNVECRERSIDGDLVTSRLPSSPAVFGSIRFVDSVVLSTSSATAAFIRDNSSRLGGLDSERNMTILFSRGRYDGSVPFVSSGSLSLLLVSDLKLSLGVRAYRTEELEPYVLNVVKKAEKLMLEIGENKEYLLIEGLAALNKVTADLLFGADNRVIQEGRIFAMFTMEAYGCTARYVTWSKLCLTCPQFVGLDDLGCYCSRPFRDRFSSSCSSSYSEIFSRCKIFDILSNLGCNHENIFNDATVPWSEYRYFDPRTVVLDFDGTIANIKVQEQATLLIVVHGLWGIKLAHPFGQHQMDLSSYYMDVHTIQQELIHFLSNDKRFADVILEKNHIPLFEVAYQGFASGILDADAYSIRLFVDHGLELLVAQSYSKNLGLYAERIRAINVVCMSSDAAARVKRQLKRLARPMYSNPPVHGARIVANIVGDPNLFDEWKQEMELMAGRIQNVWRRLHANLSWKDKSGRDWSSILKQIGMPSYTGLNKA
ncbi:Aspartate aminotransferase [Musa troglodytarum]|uniref:Aspartate aminotransferase n=1 Tax=Musa troglodytarum TaxID=320322 RepID=A0A9E7G2Q3_9LILI|nr:Aspartate aminotransferase [Musa troglodytarum]